MKFVPFLHLTKEEASLARAKLRRGSAILFREESPQLNLVEVSGSFQVTGGRGEGSRYRSFSGVFGACKPAGRNTVDRNGTSELGARRARTPLSPSLQSPEIGDLYLLLVSEKFLYSGLHLAHGGL